MTNNNNRKLPYNLRAAYAWTEAAGELELLASLAGVELFDYSNQSSDNAREHGEHDVYALDVRDLCDWLNDRQTYVMHDDCDNRGGACSRCRNLVGQP